MVYKYGLFMDFNFTEVQFSDQCHDDIYCIAGKFGGGKFGKLTLFKHLKVWRINRSANRLLIVSTTLDGYSLMNHG